MLFKNKSQFGRSMIEMLGVLAIVGILSAGGIAGYSMAMQSHKTNALIEKVQLISQQIRVLYKGDYTEFQSLDDLINSGMLSDISSPFGGNLEGSYSGTSGTEIFWISSHNVPKDACVKILTSNWGDSGVFEGFFIYGVGTFTRGTGKFPVSLSNAISYCGEGDKVLYWRFK